MPRAHGDFGGVWTPRLGAAAKFSDGSTGIGHAAAREKEKVSVTLPKVPQKGAAPGSGGALGKPLTLKPNDGSGGGRGKEKLSGSSSGLDQERFWLGIPHPANFTPKRASRVGRPSRRSCPRSCPTPPGAG